MTSMPAPAVDQELAALLTAEQLVFGLLARALFEYPDHDWIQSLATGRIFDDLPLASSEEVQEGAALLQAWTKRNAQGLEDHHFQELVQDYTRLFIGPGRVLAPPWESVYFNENRLTFQEETLAVRFWYREHGLESTRLKKEPDDHIGLELSFIAHLAGQALTALEQGAIADARQTCQAQLRFMDEHLIRWISLWTKEVDQQARTGFWPGVALLAEGYVRAFRDLVAAEMMAGQQS